MANLPTGTVTFLFTDLEASSRLWEQHPEAMKDALARHDAILRNAVVSHGGHVVKTTGDGVHAVFVTAHDAVGAAIAGQRALAAERWGVTGRLRVRMGIHTGEAQRREGDYYGAVLNRAARLTSVASGGQIVASQATADLLIDDLPDIGLVDVGEHELKGLRRHETLYLVTAPGLDVPTTSLQRQPDGSVVQRNSLVGRDEVLALLGEALARPGLVTVVGAGGIGKTRVLHEVTRRLGDQFSRTWVVDLVGVRDRPGIESVLQAALLPHRASTTDLPDLQSGDVTTQVVSAVGSRRVLLAVDNCEHVADAVSVILGGLLARCPGLSVLATSREPLAVAGGRVVPLGPLGLPAVGAEVDVDALGNVESVRLLLDRVRDAGSELRLTPATAETLAEICVQLDGIPLALELAAARLTTTTPAELRARLSRQLDVLKSGTHDPRHRTLHSAIDWSYQLLDDPEQTLLRRLGVFIGGFSLEAVEEVCSGTEGQPPATRDDVYLTLVELVSKSLVVFEHDDGRYRLLEPIRLFAHEQLQRSREADDLGERHARWILRYSRETLAAVLTGDNAAVVRFSHDLDNAHSALEWLHRTGDNKTYLQIVAALGYTWFQTDWRRGQAAAAIAVELATTSSPRLRAAILLSRGMVEQRGFESFYDSARWLTEAQSIYRTIGDTLGLAWTTFFLARATEWGTEHPSRASTLFLEAAALFRELKLPIGEAWSLINVAAETRARGDLDLAQRYLEQALTTTHDAGLTWVKANVLAELAVITLDRGDIERARSQVREGIELQRQTGDAWNLTGMLTQAARIETAAGQFDAADELLKDALRTGIAADDEFQLAQSLLILAVLSFKQADFRRARELAAATGWDLDRPHDAEGHPNSGIARALDLLRPICTERYEQAARDGRTRGVLATARAIAST